MKSAKVQPNSTAIMVYFQKSRGRIFRVCIDKSENRVAVEYMLSDYEWHTVSPQTDPHIYNRYIERAWYALGIEATRPPPLSSHVRPYT